jgi:hypothetical protein
MNRRDFILIGRVSIVSILLFLGCGSENNKQRGLFAKHHAEIRRLLVALEMFQTKNGVLPSTMEELQRNDPEVQDINLQPYKYSVTGIITEDGTSWLISIPSPKDRTQLLVGRLPAEVAVRRPKG